MKTQTRKASIPAFLFLKDAKINYVGGFFRGEDDLVFPETNPLLCFMRQIAIQTTDRLGPAQASIYEHFLKKEVWSLAFTLIKGFIKKKFSMLELKTW